MRATFGGHAVHRIHVVLLTVLVVFGLSWVVAAGPARAGVWMQISCVNPDGSTAPSQGWTDFQGTPPVADADGSTQCSAGTPMHAALTDASAATWPQAEVLQYTPPAGSSIAGGTADVFLDAQATPNAAVAALLEPALSYDSADVFVSCVSVNSPECYGGSTTFGGPVALPTNAGGNLYALAQCGGTAGYQCSQNASDGDWALVDVYWAHVLLSATDTPTATSFSGSALDQTVSGTANLQFTASVPSGPGIYQVSATIDGQSIYSATPDTNGGACVPVGTDAGTGALMFDTQQPCPASETVTIPVPTQQLGDGAHQLVVAVTDAAGNTATVLTQTITTDNTPAAAPPATAPTTTTRTPTPARRKGIHASFDILWRWKGAHTRLRTISVDKLPRAATLSLSCHGTGCPKLSKKPIPAKRVARLLKHLEGTRFRAGDRLLITVSRRHQRAERIEIRFRRGKAPRARLLHATRRPSHQR